MPDKQSLKIPLELKLREIEELVRQRNEEKAGELEEKSQQGEEEKLAETTETTASKPRKRWAPVFLAATAGAILIYSVFNYNKEQPRSFQTTPKESRTESRPDYGWEKATPRPTPTPMPASEIIPDNMQVISVDGVKTKMNVYENLNDKKLIKKIDIEDQANSHHQNTAPILNQTSNVTPSPAPAYTLTPTPTPIPSQESPTILEALVQLDKKLIGDLTKVAAPSNTPETPAVSIESVMKQAVVNSIPTPPIEKTYFSSEDVAKAHRAMSNSDLKKAYDKNDVEGMIKGEEELQQALNTLKGYPLRSRSESDLQDRLSAEHSKYIRILQEKAKEKDKSLSERLESIRQEINQKNQHGQLTNGDRRTYREQTEQILQEYRDNKLLQKKYLKGK